MKPSESIKPHLIIMVGIPGSGKSFFAEQFAKTFKAPIISFDCLRNELFTNQSQNSNDNNVVNKIASHLLNEVLKTKKTIIYEGQTSLHSDRINLSKKANSAGYETLFIWVQTEPASALKRVSKIINSKPLLSVDDFNKSIKQFSPPLKSEKAIVISGKHTYASQLKIVLQHLIKPHFNNEQTNLTQLQKNRDNNIR